MKLADIINVITGNLKMKVIFKVYGSRASICGYKEEFEKTDNELLGKEVNSICENDGFFVIKLKD